MEGIWLSFQHVHKITIEFPSVGRIVLVRAQWQELVSRDSFADVSQIGPALLA